jgi:hypothetical protein
MNRVRAGYPGQLDDLATLRREPVDTVCFFPREVTVAFTTPRPMCKSFLTTFLLVTRLPTFGRRGAIRTPVSGFKVQSPATRRPGITPSAVWLSCTVRRTPPIHRRYGPVSCDLYAHDPPSRDDLHHVRSRVPKLVRSQSLRVQSLVWS